MQNVSQVQTPKELIKVFYDGACYLCNAEINHYKRRNQKKTLEFIDISLPDFDPKQFELDPVDVHKNFHIQSNLSGTIKGVDAFAKIWVHTESMKPLQFIYRSRVGRWLLRSSYKLFVFFRPYLPRRKCETDRC
jgi:predicted DCC family thiol-disulfide oxidoreductase YuxK